MSYICNIICNIYVIYVINVIYKRKIFFYEKCGLETSPWPFLIFKESSVKGDLRGSVC